MKIKLQICYLFIILLLQKFIWLEKESKYVLRKYIKIVKLFPDLNPINTKLKKKYRKWQKIFL